MRAQGVLLSRRKTGGGAVYHDLGNTCFSFLTPYQQGQEYDYKTVNNTILISALRNLGVEAEVAGRNDIHCGGKKVTSTLCRFQALPTDYIWEERMVRVEKHYTMAQFYSQLTFKPCRSISTPIKKNWKVKV